MYENKMLITLDNQMGCESFPLLSLPIFTASCALPSNNSRHTMVASWISQESSHTVPQTPSWLISTRPSKWLLPPTSLIWVIGGPFVRRPSPHVRTQDVSVEKYIGISYKNINRLLEFVCHTAKDVKPFQGISKMTERQMDWGLEDGLNGGRGGGVHMSVVGLNVITLSVVG